MCGCFWRGREAAEGRGEWEGVVKSALASCHVQPGGGLPMLHAPASPRWLYKRVHGPALGVGDKDQSKSDTNKVSVSPPPFLVCAAARLGEVGERRKKEGEGAAIKRKRLLAACSISTLLRGCATGKA